MTKFVALTMKQEPLTMEICGFNIQRVDPKKVALNKCSRSKRAWQPMPPPFHAAVGCEFFFPQPNEVMFLNTSKLPFCLHRHDFPV